MSENIVHSPPLEKENLLKHDNNAKVHDKNDIHRNVKLL